LLWAVWQAPFVMQVVADVLDMPIKVSRAEQACALGSAMAAAVAGGIYNTVEQAQEAMGNGFETEYKPNPENVGKYKILYGKYSKFGDLIEHSLK
jgi:L-ribulokinase